METARATDDAAFLAWSSATGLLQQEGLRIDSGAAFAADGHEKPRRRQASG
jgi:hypothetical protein